MEAKLFIDNVQCTLQCFRGIKLFSNTLQILALRKALNHPSKLKTLLFFLNYVVFDKAFVLCMFKWQGGKNRTSCTQRHEGRGPTHMYL